MKKSIDAIAAKAAKAITIARKKGFEDSKIIGAFVASALTTKKSNKTKAAK